MTEQERGLAENVNLYWLIVIKTESLYENGIICKKYSIIYVEYGNNACYDKDI